MSKYDNGEKDDLYYYITEFLKEHPISELLDMIATAIKNEKEN